MNTNENTPLIHRFGAWFRTKPGWAKVTISILLFMVLRAFIASAIPSSAPYLGYKSAAYDSSAVKMRADAMAKALLIVEQEHKEVAEAKERERLSNLWKDTAIALIKDPEWGSAVLPKHLQNAAGFFTRLSHEQKLWVSKYLKQYTDSLADVRIGLEAQAEKQSESRKSEAKSLLLTVLESRK